MSRTRLIVMLLSLSVAMPAFARGGGRGGGGGGFGGGGGGQGQGFQGGGGGQGLQGGGGGGRNQGGQGGQGGGGGRGLTQGTGRGRGGAAGGGGNGTPFNLTPGSEDFMALDSMSIFARYRQQAQDINPEDTVVVAPDPPRRVGPAPTFVGVMHDAENGGYIAFLENPNNLNGTSVIPVREGTTLDWDGSVVKSITADSMTLEGGNANRQNNTIAIGNNLRNEAQQFSPITGFQSQDSFNRGNPNNLNQNAQGGLGGGRGGRGGRGGGGGGFGGGGAGGGGFGGGGAGGGGFGGGGAGGGGFGGGGAGGGPGGFAGFGANAPAAAPVPIVTSDPPLPQGTADTLEERMKQRRAAQGADMPVAP